MEPDPLKGKIDEWHQVVQQTAIGVRPFPGRTPMPPKIRRQPATGLIAFNQIGQSFPDLAGCTEPVKQQIGRLTRPSGTKVKPGHISLLPGYARAVGSELPLLPR